MMSRQRRQWRAVTNNGSFKVSTAHLLKACLTLFGTFPGLNAQRQCEISSQFQVIWRKARFKKNYTTTASSVYIHILVRGRRGYREITQIEIVPKELKLTGKRITYFITIVVSFIVKVISTLRGNVTECSR